MAVIPPFGADGLLPPGEYEVSFEELRQSRLVLGPGDPSEWPAWDAAWRSTLVDNLEVLTRQLWQVGITEVFADGSFSEDKDHPNDIDGYFVCDLARLKSGELARELNLLEPDKIWTWDPASRRACRGYPKWQLPMWHKYRVELYPHVRGLRRNGIHDNMGTNWSSPRRSASRAATAPRGASSRSNMKECKHDPQRERVQRGRGSSR